MDNNTQGNGNNSGNNQNNNQGKNNHNGQMVMMFILITLVALLFMSLISRWQTQMTTKEITYTKFMEMVEAGEIESVKLTSEEIDITPKKKEQDLIMVTYYTGYVGDDELISILKEHDVEISGEIPDNTAGWIYNIVSFLLPLVLLWIIMGFLMRRMGGGAMGVGKSNAKVYVEKKSGVTF